MLSLGFKILVGTGLSRGVLDGVGQGLSFLRRKRELGTNQPCAEAALDDGYDDENLPVLDVIVLRQAPVAPTLADGRILLPTL